MLENVLLVAFATPVIGALWILLLILIKDLFED